MPIVTPCPLELGLHSQTERTDVTDEEFQAIFESRVPPSMQKIRWIFFIIFLGPIKVIFTLIFVLLFSIDVAILALFSSFWKNEKEFRFWVRKMSYPFARGALFFSGILRITVHGKLDPDTRCVLSNHLTLIDAVVMYTMFPVSFLAMSSLSSAWFFKNINKVADMVYVDRSKRQGITSKIKDIQNDPARLALCIFPEGKITDGSCILGFRTGAFVSDTPSQCICLRYKQYLLPKDMATVAWIGDNDLSYIFGYFTIPFLKLEIEILPPIRHKGDEKTPKERAIEAQLQMANFFGVPALSRNNKEIFMKKEE